MASIIEDIKSLFSPGKGPGGEKKEKDDYVWLEKVDTKELEAAQKQKEKIYLTIVSAILVISLIWLSVIGIGYLAGKQSYAKAAQNYTKTSDGRDDPKVNFQQLKKDNKDIQAWIYIDGTPINYPILWCKDDNTYLRHTWDGKYNVLGSIMVSQYNHPTFNDQNTLVFGHNSHGSTMFGTLNKYSDPEYFKTHGYIDIILPDRILRYQVISAYETDTSSDVYTVFWKDNNNFVKWKQEQIGRSDVKVKNLIDESKTITLSTCARGNSSSRYVVIGQLSQVLPN